MSTQPAVLAIGGSDSSGGAGLARDVQVLTELGTTALCTLTAVTAQTNTQVAAVHELPPELVREQIEAALATTRIHAIKIGMLGTGAIAETVAGALPSRARVPIVLDPVLLSSSGGRLFDDNCLDALRGALLPRVTLVTPNLIEAAAILGQPVATDEAGMLEQARDLLTSGVEAVLLKGGHAGGAEATDMLVTATGAHARLSARRVDAGLRGTGCALSSAIAASLAEGFALEAACEQAKAYLSRKFEQALLALS